jgi:hypothetical protein
MRSRFRPAAVAALSTLFVLSAAPLSANPIERACNQSPRPEATRALCSCIGGAADMTLTHSDMREGRAVLLATPPARRKSSLSDTRRNDAFWSRWQRFAETAEAALQLGG